MFNCVVACFFYAFVIPADGNPYSFGTTCVRYDSAQNKIKFEREFGNKPNHYRITKGDGDVVESYGYGASAFCRADTKEEMSIHVMLWGGDCEGCSSKE